MSPPRLPHAADVAESTEPATGVPLRAEETLDVAAAKHEARRRMLILLTVLSATFVQLVDISIVNTAIPSVQRNLHATFSTIQLVIAGYQLSFACTLITAARLGDIYGRRKLFIMGMTAFTIASALCGAAVSPGMLVIARVVQGVASGLMFPQVLSVIQVTFPPHERGKAFGIFGATIGIATIAGPLLGGSLIALNPFDLSWRTIFYVNLPIGVAAVIAAVRLLPESKAPNADRLDVPGAVLVATGLFLLVCPLAIGRDHGWPLWSFAMLAASVPILAWFAIYERRKTAVNDSPLLLTTLFQDSAFNTGMALSGIFFLGIAPFFFVFSLFLQIGMGYSALGAGFTTLPFALGSAMAASQSDRLVQRLGRRVLSIGTGLLVIGHAGLIASIHVAGTHLHSYQLWPVLFVCGVGLGLFIGPVSNVILSGVRKEAAGSASGVISTTQLVAGGMGVALLGIIFFGLLGANADKVSGQVAGPLRAQLVAAGASEAAADYDIAGFRLCFAKFAHAHDPTAPIAGCRRSAAASSDPIVTALLHAGRLGQKKEFSTSVQRALTWEVVVFLLSFLLVSRLPQLSTEMRGGSPGSHS